MKLWTKKKRTSCKPIDDQSCKSIAKIFNNSWKSDRERALMVGHDDGKNWIITNGRVAVFCRKSGVVQRLSAPLLRILVDGPRTPDIFSIDLPSDFKPARVVEKYRYICAGVSCAIIKSEFGYNAIQEQFLPLITDDDKIFSSYPHLLVTNGGRFKAIIMMMDTHGEEFPRF